MIRRAVETLAAFLAGAVLLDPVGEALFYGSEGFPVDGDAYGALRLLSAPLALVLLVVGAGLAFALPTRLRGWPAASLALLASVVLVAYAPLDNRQAIMELGPPYRLLAALVGGLAIGALAAAILPAAEPTAGLAAGIVVNLSVLPYAPAVLLGDRGYTGFVPILAVVAASAAALLTRDRRPAGGPPGLLAGVTAAAVVGAVIGAAFHMQYVDRALDDPGQVGVALAVLVGAAVLWAVLVAALVAWTARRAGPGAARLALVCAGGPPALFAAAQGNAWFFGTVGPWALAVLGGAAGAALGIRLARPAAVAAGLVACTALAVVLFSMEEIGGWWVAPGAALAAFTLAAALGGRTPVDAVYGLLGLVVSVPLLIGLIGLVDLVRGGAGTGEPWIVVSPLWACALATALALVLWRPRSPAPADAAPPDAAPPDAAPAPAASDRR
jgi:hypothetical protein